MQIILTIVVVIYVTVLYWNIVDIQRCKKELKLIKKTIVEQEDLYEIKSDIEKLKIETLELQANVMELKKKPIPKCRPKNAEQKTKAVVLQRTNLSD